MDEKNYYLDYVLSEDAVTVRLLQSDPAGSYVRSQATIPLESLAQGLAPYLKPKKPAKKATKKRAKK